MYEYKIEVVRDGRWWMVHIPEVDGLTQARRLAEVETMAREYIALDRGVPYDEVTVETVSIRAGAAGEMVGQAHEIRALRAEAHELEGRAIGLSRDFCRRLVGQGIPVRDVGELLDISPQRVSQLANAANV